MLSCLPMTFDYLVRDVQASDAPALLEIYSPHILGTPTSFETKVPSKKAWAGRIATLCSTFPFLVAERGTADPDSDQDLPRLLGYAYASSHRARAAYRWSTETSVYVAAAAQRRGVGWRLYRCLLQLLELQGFVNAYAGITLPNPASVRLHENLGFKPVGIYRHVGYKLGQWHDVGWWSRTLAAPAASPLEPTPASQLRDGGEWRRCLEPG